MSQALYQRIAASLRQRILSGGHPVGDVLPSENELAGAYRTSRVTVRKAFQILESEGLIKARQGKGYIVQPPQHTVFTLVFGPDPGQGRYRFLEVNIATPDERLSRELSLREGQPVIAIRRLLERAGEPVAYDEKFLPYERGRPALELELRFSEFPELFADRSSAFLRTEMQITTSRPPPHVRLALGVEEDRLITVEQLIRDAEGVPIGFGREYLTQAYGPLKASSGYAAAEE